MGKSKDYEKAQKKYSKSIDEYVNVSSKAYNNAYDNSKKYFGDEGYKRALELGKEGAMSTSNASISSGTNSARASGMNKAQASAMGNQSAINAYGQGLNNQQQIAYSSGQDASTNEYNKANGISGVYGNKSNLYGNNLSSAQAEANNEYNRLWGTIGGVGSLLTSDERLKHYKDISSSIKIPKKAPNNESIIKYKIDIKKYK